MSDNTAQVIHMVNAHEERIQRLENLTAELASSVAEQNATMQAFSQQMRMMSDSVCEKLEDVSTRLSDKIGAIVEVNKELAEETKVADTRLAKLETNIETKDKSSVVRDEFWRKVLANVISAAIGAGVTLLLAYLRGH